LALLESAEPGVAFAEKLGEWLSLPDAIALRAVLTATPPARLAGTASGGLCDELARTQAALVKSIRSSPAPAELASHFDAARRTYVAHQREMELAIRALRANARAVLAKTSPALARLAALDGVLDGVLSERESKLLANMPALLDKRFQQLRQTHPQPDPSAPGHATWPERFWQELQTVLLAELDIRLQPALGLIEAFTHRMDPLP
jgi:hypothetical protein